MGLALSSKTGPSGKPILGLKFGKAENTSDIKPVITDRKTQTPADIWLHETFDVIRGFMPLAIGAGAEIKSAGIAAGYSKTAMAKALKKHTRSKAYLSAVAKEGSTRHALDGRTVGAVLEEHRIYADKKAKGVK